MTKYFSYKDPTHTELGLMAMAASPTPEEACVFLKAEHNIKADPKALKAIVRNRPEQYEELRARLVPLREQTLTHNLLDNALYASNVTKVAMDQLMERLEERKIPAEYLSRVARDIQDVQSKAVEKKQTLEGKPSIITEVRTPKRSSVSWKTWECWRVPPRRSLQL